MSVRVVMQATTGNTEHGSGKKNGSGNDKGLSTDSMKKRPRQNNNTPSPQTGPFTKKENKVGVSTYKSPKMTDISNEVLLKELRQLRMGQEELM